MKSLAVSVCITAVTGMAAVSLLVFFWCSSGVLLVFFWCSSGFFWVLLGSSGVLLAFFWVLLAFFWSSGVLLGSSVSVSYTHLTLPTT